MTSQDFKTRRHVTYDVNVTVRGLSKVNARKAVAADGRMDFASEAINGWTASSAAPSVCVHFYLFTVGGREPCACVHGADSADSAGLNRRITFPKHKKYPPCIFLFPWQIENISLRLSSYLSAAKESMV